MLIDPWLIIAAAIAATFVVVALPFAAGAAVAQLVERSRQRRSDRSGASHPATVVHPSSKGSGGAQTRTDAV